MGEIRNDLTGRICVLEAEHVVGRSPRSELRLDHSEISARHALLRYNGKCWEVRDLGSRNGTVLDGLELSTAEDTALAVGSVLRFGQRKETWTLTDDSPPGVMAVSVDGSLAARADGTVLALPSADDPALTIYRASSGEWFMERADEPLATLVDHDVFEAAGKTWRFCCPSVVVRTQPVSHSLELRESELSFGVSADEEYVELRVHCGGEVKELGSRSHYYLLLTLARARLEEATQGLQDQLAGWVYQEDLLRGLGVTQAQLNIDVFRVRKQFATAGFVDAANAIERRSSTKQLRIGVSRLRVQRI